MPCESAARFVDATLADLDRSETVIAMNDSFSDGPLGDVDAGGRSRIDWYKRINPEIDEQPLASFVDDADLWARVRATNHDVMLWHGPRVDERIFALRACWHLRDRPERVHEVAIRVSNAKLLGGLPRPALYDAVSIAKTDRLAKAWQGRTRVLDVEARAKRWEELRAIEGDWIRTLDGGDDIVQLPLTAFDGLILAEASEWTESPTAASRAAGP